MTDASSAPPRAGLKASATTITCMVSAAASALAALFLGLAPLSADTVRIAFVADAALYSVPLAMLVHRVGLASPSRAAGVVAVFAVAALVALSVAGWALGVIRQPPDVNQVEFLYGAIGGFVGAVLALVSFPVLGIIPATPAAFGRTGIAVVCLSLVGGVACAVLDVSLTTSVVWVAPLWQMACAPLLAVVLKDAKTRQAVPMR